VINRVDSSAELPHRCTVLVVDDDADVRDVLRVALTDTGYDVRTASNGRDALHLLRSTAATCMIVLDLMLPGMTAAQFRAVQLRDRSLGWIPLVVLSAAQDGAHRARALGARSFVPKPIDVDLLRRTLGQIGCRRAQMPRPPTDDRTAELAGAEPPG